MCTVSFTNTSSGIVVTSNRDENIKRPQAIAPEMHVFNGKNILFPKDTKAGGTWFCATQDGNLLVLLNGAEEKHIPLGNYQKSRGIIVLEIASSTNWIEFWDNLDLLAVEPFTLVVYFEKNLYQLRWNSILKTTTVLDPKKNYIWSSTTLYPKKIREERTQWFDDFLKENETLTPENVLDFHLHKNKNNTDFGLQIHRNNGMKTVSCTQAVISENTIQTSYFDLIDKNSTTKIVTTN